jgi:hypothetical protein
LGLSLYKLWNVDSHSLSNQNELETKNTDLPGMGIAEFERKFPPPEDHKSLEYLIWKMKHIDPAIRPSAYESMETLKKLFPEVGINF